MVLNVRSWPNAVMQLAKIGEDMIRPGNTSALQMNMLFGLIFWIFTQINVKQGEKLIERRNRYADFTN